MRERVYLNDGWKFSGMYEDRMRFPDFDESGMEEVRLPHTCKELPFHYFDEELYQMVSGYRRKIFAPKNWQGKNVFLIFEGVAHESEVFVNGKKVCEHHCGYTGFSINIGNVLNYGAENFLTVKADSRENLNFPPFGFVIDYMTYGGIYRDVYMEVREQEYLEDIFVKPQAEIGQRIYTPLESEITVHMTEDGGFLRQWMRRKGETEYQLLGEGEVKHKKEILRFSNFQAELWDVEHPVLYEIRTELLRNGKILDAQVVTTGFRKAEFRRDGFYLNGRKLKIRGLNRHQSYPYVGYAMPASIQKMDADILKKELGVNAVRTSHYPQSHYFLNRCDELGLLVFTEIPGWQHIGDEKWKEQAVANVRDMILQYRNHTSIILWGVRINESKDDDVFYERTNAVAHELDPTRLTGGVRACKRSSLLEDVYTYNDFIHDGKQSGCEKKSGVTSDMEKPYLISEYNGHMYPTKAYDCENKRTEHALRHANVLNAVAGQSDIAGCFGWCMADYNTHKDFGSGDRICYHGVLDMFRNPKTAAAVYAGQQEERPVLEISSSMDIGEHPASNWENLYIFTNADSVRMYKNERFIHEYKREESHWHNLKHGPILMDDFIGNAFETEEHMPKGQADSLKKLLNAAAHYGVAHIPKRLYPAILKLFLGYRMNMAQVTDFYTRYVGDWGGASTRYRFEAIKNNKVVKTVIKEPMKQVRLQVQADHQQLKEEYSYDVAAVRIQAVDEHGNILNFYNEPICFEIEGEGVLIGPPVIALQGGMGGTYVKTKGLPGKILLKIKSAQTEPICVEFMVEIKENTKECSAETESI